MIFVIKKKYCCQTTRFCCKKTLYCKYRLFLLEVWFAKLGYACASVLNTKIKELFKVANIFNTNLKGIINAFTNSFSNAMVERLNGKMQEIKQSEEGTEPSIILEALYSFLIVV